MAIGIGIDTALADRPATDLETVRAAGDLQQRYDAKYVLTADIAAELLDALDSNWHVLEVARRRSTGYRSSYFDDEHFGLFRDHVKGRRLRYKVRTRRYGDEPEEMLEVKLKSGRGATDKRRIQRNGSSGTQLTVAECDWISDVVVDAYGRQPSAPLHYVLGLAYTRRTLFSPATGDRLTIDTGVVADTPAGSVAPVGDAVVVEVKSANWHGPTVRQLQRQSIRPLTFSKYCAALASLHPELDQRARQRAQRSFDRNS